MLSPLLAVATAVAATAATSPAPASGATGGAPSVAFAAPNPALQLAAGNATERIIYNSSQTPGYTAWTALWSMPGGEIMTNFVEAKGMYPMK